MAGRCSAALLPETFYRSTSDLQAFANYSMNCRTYRYFKGNRPNPFGYGLSDSRFCHGAPSASAAIQAGGSVTVTAEVRDVSKRAATKRRSFTLCLRTALSPHLETEGFQRF
ncbi:MAG: hypothetical protein WBC92_14120 [Terracidiphilus sp.]